MAHIASIGAGLFSELALTATVQATEPADQSAYEALTFVDVGKINTFPNIGAPANVVNVPQFSQKQSAQIQGQSDAPSLDFTLNYVPADHVTIQGYANDNIQRAYRVRMANAELPATLVATTEHDDFYWLGQVAAFQTAIGLQGNTATFTVTAATDFQGPYTTTS